MYARAEEGELANVPGVSTAYEPPAKPDLVLDTAKFPVDYCVQQIVKLLTERGMLSA
jgi:adenylylsulfate kinase-like enzyme